MTREQRRVVALIVAVVVALIGLVVFIAWSGFHRDRDAEALPASAPTSPASAPTSPASAAVATTAPAQIDGYSGDFEATDAQKDAAVEAASALAQWSQEESQADRTKRLEAFFVEDVASEEAPWQELYGSIEGASVTVDSAGEPSTSSNDGTTIGVGVMVTYTVHIPHDDSTEVTTQQTGLWVISMPVTATDTTKATAAQWLSV